MVNDLNPINWDVPDDWQVVETIDMHTGESP